MFSTPANQLNARRALVRDLGQQRRSVAWRISGVELPTALDRDTDAVLPHRWTPVA